MTKTNNNISIKVGDVTINSNDIPKNGIDLNKLSKNSKAILSCFDTNGDNKLSRQEIENAISLFEAQDKQVEGGLRSKEKDGELDEYELANVKFKKPITKKQLAEIELSIVTSMCMESRDITAGYVLENARSAERKVKSSPDANKLVKVENIEVKKLAAETLYREMVTVKALEKGLKRTNNDMWLKDDAGNHYKWNGADYQKVSNVYYVSKDGTYKTKENINKKGQKRLATYSPNGRLWSVQARNYKNSIYKNKEYQAKILGLNQDDRDFDYYHPGENLNYTFMWNDESHEFRRVR